VDSFTVTLLKFFTAQVQGTPFTDACPWKFHRKVPVKERTRCQDQD